VLKTVIYVTNTLSDTLNIVCLMPISNLLKEDLDYAYCCVIQRNALPVKYFSLVAVMLIECMEGKGIQGGGGHEYAHTVHSPTNAPFIKLGRV